MYSKVSAVSVSVGRTTPLLIHRVRRSPKRVRGHITRGLLRGLCSSVLGWPNHLCLAAFLEYLTEVGLGATISASTSRLFALSELAQPWILLIKFWPLFLAII